VVLHRAVKQSGQITRHDVLHAAAESAHPEAVGAASLDSVSAIVSILGANLENLKVKEKHRSEVTTPLNPELCAKFETDLAGNGGDAQDSAAVNLQADVDIPEAVKGFERVSLRSRHSVDLDGKYFR